MEDLIINAKEHKLLKKFQKQLEECYRVEIRMPKASTLDSDVVFISIHGEKYNRDCVKKFLSEKMNLPTKNIECKENIVLITLSDSEEEAVSPKDDSVCIIEPSSCSENFSSLTNAQTVCSESLGDAICIIESSVNTKDTSAVMRNVFNHQTQCQGKRKKLRKNSKKNKKVRSKAVLSSAEVSELCEVTSTTDDVATKEKIDCDDSICVLSEAVTCTEDPAEFIPLYKKNKSNSKGTVTNKNFCNQPQQDEVNNNIKEPVPTLRSLRPIVIDGSNVAMEHGRVSRSFSAKGIQLAVEYFLNRGHTQVTAFVPKFRRIANPNHNFPTKDPAILDDLAEKQLVVFTPSRRVNGKCIASYDDRFIVQLAAQNGGVIVSNDNFRDLINESESFKEAVEQRLLMFCFVGDVFMVPEDPLGRNGPKLSDYLCFPPDST